MKGKLKYIDMLRVILAISISLLIVFIIIFMSSKNPIGAISSFILGPISSVRRIGNIIELMIPLLFSGAAIIFLFRTGLFNLSAEGAIFSGVVISTILGIVLKTPPLVTIIISIVTAGLVGAVVTLIPGILKVFFNANEIVTSLMLNFVCLNVGLYFIHGFFLDKNVNSPYSYKLQEGTALAQIVPGTRIHMGLVIAIVMIILSWLVLYKTSFGVKTNLVGSNRLMSEYTGIRSSSIILLTQLIGGFLAGMGGSVELFGMYSRFQFNGLTGYGWDGIPIAIIASGNPKLVPFAAMFFAYLKIGADIMARQSDIPFEIVQIIQAIMIVFITAQSLLSGYRKRIMTREIQNIEKGE